MDARRTGEDVGRRALETTLGAYFAVQWLEAESRLYVYRSLVPSFLLWLHAWHPLPEVVSWLAVLGWGACAAMTLVLAAAAARQGRRLHAALPEAQRVVRVSFVPDAAAPAVSALLLHLSLGASALLWLHGLAPQVLRAEAVSMAAKSWALLLVAALANKYFERP